MDGDVGVGAGFDDGVGGGVGGGIGSARSRPGYQAVLSNEQIRQRDGDRCARCGLPGGPLDVHHRWLRSAGTDERACNRVTLCRRCHDWLHRNRDYARRDGWIVSRSADPAEIPVDHALWPAGPVLLLDDGGVRIWT